MSQPSQEVLNKINEPLFANSVMQQAHVGQIISGIAMNHLTPFEFCSLILSMQETAVVTWPKDFKLALEVNEHLETIIESKTQQPK